MHSYEQAVFIAAPTSTIFDYITDQTTLPDWINGLVSSQIIGGGPMQVGTKLRQVRQQGNKLMTGEATVVVHEPPYEQAVTCNILGVNTRFTFELAPQAGRTRVNLRSDFCAPWYLKLMEPVVGAMCKGCNEKTLLALKSCVEAKQKTAVAV